jgi:membrane protein implicated in regulation of membrane protease activity
MLWVGLAIVVIAVVISVVGAIWVGVPAVFAGLILIVVALVRGARRGEPAEPPA